ncbi:MarR family transcriptional regulator [Cytophaga sp. FL35]|uniref:MarR family winged helix-turn-helix transcriptional regulator n=1 Tax=Cytophaga sp. FL35 TaxID=1904456 RepID=UPI001653B68A|nr:MarR family transcriptional regulator [Cytophaga sp. FL35]MBC7000546.1 MarR family transcriptional regulator [Cytophaga sp. FL35]
MSNDFLYEMGYPGLTARLKRLNDLFVTQTRQFYQEYNIDIEPNWHMIFVLLEKEGKLAVTEIADFLQISHPGVIKLIKKMKRNGYLISEQDPNDSRKHLLSLSEKAIEKLPQLHYYWEAATEALEDMMDHNTKLLEELRIVEQHMISSDFKERIVQKLNEKN